MRCLYRPSGGSRILTDDKAPVELLGMRTLDKYISTELEYYKEIYDKKGLEGIFRLFS